MMTNNPVGRKRSGVRFTIPAVTLLLLGAAMLSASMIAWSEDALARGERQVTLGTGKKKLKPNCGRDFSRDCIVEGKVSAYQVKKAKSSKPQPYVVPWSGKIVSWSISLANPTKREITAGGVKRPAQSPFFNALFGSPASAGISVLRRVNKKKKGPPSWKMVRHSPVEILNPYFGTTVRFALEEPLTVIKGHVVALTIPTWAPALWKPASCNFNAVSGVKNPGACRTAERQYTWRASRATGRCRLGTRSDGGPNEALEKTTPQRKIGSIRRYGCLYGSNALLYSVTVVGRK